MFQTDSSLTPTETMTQLDSYTFWAIDTFIYIVVANIQCIWDKSDEPPTIQDERWIVLVIRGGIKMLKGKQRILHNL